MTTPQSDDTYQPQSMKSVFPDLEELLEEVRPLFRRTEPHIVLTDYVHALLGDIPRKNSWSIAKHAGYPTARPFEHLLNGAVWDAAALRDLIRERVAAQIGDEGGTLVAHDMCIAKKGPKSVGVAPQVSEITGSVENLQVVPMLAYAVGPGFAYVDRELYLPRSWSDDAGRRTELGIPADRGYVTKPHLVGNMLARTLDAGAPVSWFVSGPGYGGDPDLRRLCHQRSVGYAVAAPADRLPLEPRPRTAGVTRSVRLTSFRSGTGPAGAHHAAFPLSAWTVTKVALRGESPSPGFQHSIVQRREPQREPGRALTYLLHAPAGTPLEQMLGKLRYQRRITEFGRWAAAQVGLGEFQARKWRPVYRHLTISMLAIAVLNAAGPHRRAHTLTGRSAA